MKGKAEVGLVGLALEMNPTLDDYRKQGNRKYPKDSDTQRNCCNHPNICTTWLYH